MRFVSCFALALLLTVPFAPAQTQPSTSTPAPAQVATSGDTVDVQELVMKQFGPEFQVVGESHFDIDMNGDGIPDAVIVARSKDPLLGEGEFHYKVVDPYNDYFGYGNPHVTLQFAMQTDPAQEHMVLLIIHGAGAEGWRAAVPHAKFVIVNLPYKTLSFKRATLKKKLVTMIVAEDVDEVEAAVYWSGKIYKWEPIGASH
ncbi:MAG TPA: hypothetical protein VE994_00715 [Terriglobales bacterium]|nr:hypothetical protein [Terriglobales bacterium]